MGGKTIFHIDANSAFLSWSAAARLYKGETIDIRDIPSIVGGDPKSRHGIVLAKSIPSKKYGIQTGETLSSALSKCPTLTIVPPEYDIYVRCSNAMVEILKEYSPKHQRYSIDECFLDCTNMENLHGKPIEVAYAMKERIKKELGFTVNVGISSNKLLAKMGSDLKKPDMVHSLYPEEMEEKMWPLPVGDLFMVGRKTMLKLYRINVKTIGDLANYNVNILKDLFKSFGEVIWKFANGIDDSEVRKSNFIDVKGIGNSTTIPFDVDNKREAYMVLLSLTEIVAMRLRDSENLCRLVAVSIRSNEFANYSRQRKLSFATDSTSVIYGIVKELFNESWKEEKVRQMGVRVSELCSNEFYQTSFFQADEERLRSLDKTIDGIRLKYGTGAITRSVFVNSGIKAITGGYSVEDYPPMSSIL
ncbi:MAG TPA: DNA polymerase IV [Clostridiaceae bacterium]